MSLDTAAAVPRPPARGSAAPVLTGAQAVVRSLEMLGVTDVFGLPGGAILPVYDPLMDSTDLRHILVRHEQGAGHAAEGYASASGKVGVAIATSGPGATNLVTAIADAYMDSVPIVAITGQVFSNLMGTDAFQEADIVGITMPITKHSFLVKDAAEIPAAIAAAYEIASTGRPGPVLVDITKDAQQAEAPFVWPPKVDLPGYRPVTKAHGKQIQAAAQLLAAARKPVLYVGGGVIRARASAELLTLAETTGAPVVTTLMARGAFPDSHAQHLGMPGMHGTVPAVLALQEAEPAPNPTPVGDLFAHRAAGDVDRIGNKLAGQSLEHRCGDIGTRAILCLHGGRAQVRRHRDLRQLKQRGIRARLRGVDVKTRTAVVAGSNRIRQGLLIYEAAAGGDRAVFRGLLDGRVYTFTLCVEAWFGGTLFGRATVDADVRAVQSTAAPRGYTFVVGPTAHVDGARANWTIDDPTPPAATTTGPAPSSEGGDGPRARGAGQARDAASLACAASI